MVVALSGCFFVVESGGCTSTAFRSSECFAKPDMDWRVITANQFDRRPLFTAIFDPKLRSQLLGWRSDFALTIMAEITPFRLAEGSRLEAKRRVQVHSEPSSSCIRSGYSRHKNRAAMIDVPIDLFRRNIPPEIIKLIPEDVVWEYRVVPINRDTPDI